MSSPIQRRLARYELRRRSTFAVADALYLILLLLPQRERSRLISIVKRLRNCAMNQNVVVRTPKHEATFLQVWNKRVCKIRLCPQCLYRLACAERAVLVACLEQIWILYPGCKAILLTLTTRNRPFSELKAMLRDHQAGLKRFFKLKPIVDASLGAYTSIELDVRGTPDAPEAGIHSHTILMVPAGYFANDVPAIWQHQFRDLWQKAARLDYAPIVDCRVARAGDGTDDRDAVFGAIVECAKYCVSLESIFEHRAGKIRCDGVIAATILDAFHRQRLHRFDRCFAEARKRRLARPPASPAGVSAANDGDQHG